MIDNLTDEDRAALAHKAERERRYDLRTPIIRAIYDVMRAIEECGASEKLTRAVTLAGALMEPVRVLLEERDALAGKRAQVPPREPTRTMFCAVDRVWDPHSLSDDDIRQLWQAMYDAYSASPTGVRDDARDAKRYRWLRHHKSFRIPESTDYWGFFSVPPIKGESLDAAIDAAIAEQERKP